MRERLWLWLRNNSVLRKLYALPIATRLMQALSYKLLPSSEQRNLRVRGGLGAGLILRLNPRWEVPFWEGRYELEVERTVLENLRPGEVFYDVGAAFGFYSLLAARAGARVFAFEPDTKNAESFVLNAKLNSLQNKTELMPVAVTSWTGHGRLSPAGQDRGHGNAFLIPEEDTVKAATTVPCITLDDFCRANPLPRVIKIDVEGSESDVLKGAQDLFDRCRPLLICEIHDTTNAIFVSGWLTTRQYKLHWVENQNNYPKHLIASPI